MRAWAAHLRVYEPLVAFSPQLRSQWQAYGAEVADRASRQEVAAAEAGQVLSAVLAPRLGVSPEAERAYVMDVDGLLYVCPWTLTHRMLQAWEEFRGGLPDQIAALFVPPDRWDAAEEALEEVRAESELHPHIRTSALIVPTPWLLLVEASEQELVLDGPERSLRYVVTMANARRRAGRALAVLRRTLPDTNVVGELTEVARWLEEFHPYSRVEVDYGGLVDLISDEDLAADCSPADLQQGLQALRDGDGQAAAAAYLRVVERMRALSSRSSAN